LQPGILAAVKARHTIVTMMLVALWLPVSSHAFLEYAGLIHQRHGDHEADSSGSPEHDSDRHEAADGHCVLSSPHVGIPMPDAVATQSLFCWLGLKWTSHLHVELQPSGIPPPGTAPPQFSQRWQFSFRTALPARAPSLFS